MTYSDTQPRGTLKYRLLSASLRPADSPLADPGSWGHEYVRHLAAELGDEYTLRETESTAEAQLPGTTDDLRALAKECATFLLGHNAEPDAVDLLEEMEIVQDIAQLVDDNTYTRVCQYMIRFVLWLLFYWLLNISTDVLAYSLLQTISLSSGQHILSTSNIINFPRPLP